MTVETTVLIEIPMAVESTVLIEVPEGQGVVVETGSVGGGTADAVGAAIVLGIL